MEASYETARQDLLTRLLSSIKRCQIRFGGHRSELATEGDDAVRDLCISLENVLEHGLRVARKPSDLILSRLRPSLKDATIWSFVKSFLSKQELDRFYLLKNITTDAGRGRAWIRAALNDHSLEKYMRHVLSNEVELCQFYEKWSFLVDVERSSMLLSMAAGISSIPFALNIDREELNEPFSVKPEERENLIALPLTSSNVNEEDGRCNAESSKKKKKKRRVPGQLVSFDGDEVRTEALESPDISVQVSPKNFAKTDAHKKLHKSLEKQILIIQTENKSRKGSSSRSLHQSASIEYDPINLSSDQKRDDSDEDEVDVYSRGRQTDSRSEVGESSISSNKLTPLRDSGVGALIPVNFMTSVDQDIQSEDSMSIRSYGEESDYASACTGVSGRLDVSRRGSNGIPSKASSVHNSTISREELKQALLSVMERKNELQEMCGSLKKLLMKESETAAGLRDELNDARRKSKEVSDKMDLRIQTISRENDLLKHQLKKYVGAVQKLRDGPQAYETLAQLEGKKKVDGEEPRFVDYHYEASEYEKKLIQVAEMQGELIEFNEHLQRIIQTKDMAIHRMREELVDLRGPLPNEGADDDSCSIISENIDSTSLASGPTSRALLNIWIPSVFLSGSGSKTHHVYQVYLRIKDDEWNIYRRYSDFYGLHRELRQQESLVGTFDFPPKKTVGYKAEKVVEERRKRLQTYLRRIVNLMVQTNPALSAKPNKENVLLLMPFFAENSFAAQRSSSRSQSQTRSIFNRRRAANTSVPPQLAL